MKKIKAVLVTLVLATGVVAALAFAFGSGVTLPSAFATKAETEQTSRTVSSGNTSPSPCGEAINCPSGGATPLATCDGDESSCASCTGCANGTSQCGQ